MVSYPQFLQFWHILQFLFSILQADCFIHILVDSSYDRGVMVNYTLLMSHHFFSLTIKIKKILKIFITLAPFSYFHLILDMVYLVFKIHTYMITIIKIYDMLPWLLKFLLLFIFLIDLPSLISCDLLKFSSFTLPSIFPLGEISSISILYWSSLSCFSLIDDWLLQSSRR